MKKNILAFYYLISRYIPYLFYEAILRFIYRNIVVVNGYFDMSWGKRHYINWGDDLNFYFAEDVFKRKMVVYNSSLISHLLNEQNYMVIGSVLHDANKNTIVWGAGMISKNHLPKEKPKKILAVRGKLTRKCLIDNNIDCPEVYGDPALLLPLIYKPKIKKKYKVGIIPHIFDENNQLLYNYSSLHSDVKIISMRKYENWRDVINQINECSYILSSSLHGLIVADAYGVPNVWIEVSDRVYGNGFKFHDYFSSVGRTNEKSVVIQNSTDLDHAIEKAKMYNSIYIDLQPLIESCPFPLYL